MDKTSAQVGYLQYLRKTAVGSCGAASHALSNYKKKKKKATIVKEAQGFWVTPEMEVNEYARQLQSNPMLLDADTQQRLLQHNQEALRQAGGILGAGTGLLGAGGAGAGIGALAAKAGKRLRGAGLGAAIGGGAGLLAGGLLGPGIGERAAERATQKDIETLNQLAQDKAMSLGYSPFGLGNLEGMKARATFGEGTGDPRAFALEQIYRQA